MRVGCVKTKQLRKVKPHYAVRVKVVLSFKNIENNVDAE